jgi:hypothetical protein
MDHLRIILDKSVVYGLTDSEIDSLDRYFFLIVPPILIAEILADLAKATTEPDIANKIARHSYRISGNRGLTREYEFLLGNSLMGYEVPMEGKYLPAGETMARTRDGSIATFIETDREDEMIARWERKDFTEHEKAWAAQWRRAIERPISPKLYLKKIAEAGLQFTPPNSDEELAANIDSLLNEKKLQGKLLFLLFVENRASQKQQIQIINRWFKEGTPMLKDFAPYAFFCVRANFLWALGLTNPKLFKLDRNDRKDLEYCYYLPHCEMFASKDNKHRRLVPFLLKEGQSFVDGEELKTDLRRLSEEWEKLTREEQISIRAERGHAPPEDQTSLVFLLWKKHRNEISRPAPKEMLKATVVDSSLPEDEQVPQTLEDMLKKIIRKKVDGAKNLTPNELDKLKQIHGPNDPTTFMRRTTKISRARALKMHPELNESDLD